MANNSRNDFFNQIEHKVASLDIVKNKYVEAFSSETSARHEAEKELASLQEKWKVTLDGLHELTLLAKTEYSEAIDKSTADNLITKSTLAKTFGHSLKDVTNDLRLNSKGSSDSVEDDVNDDEHKDKSE